MNILKTKNIHKKSIVIIISIIFAIIIVMGSIAITLADTLGDTKANTESWSDSSSDVTISFGPYTPYAPMATVTCNGISTNKTGGASTVVPSGSTQGIAFSANDGYRLKWFTIWDEALPDKGDNGSSQVVYNSSGTAAPNPISGFDTVSTSGDLKNGQITLTNITHPLHICLYFEHKVASISLNHDLCDILVYENGEKQDRNVTSYYSCSYDTNVKLEFVPKTGYEIDYVVIDRENKGAISSYSFPSICEDHYVVTYYKAIRYSINSTTDGHGNISGPTTIAYGSSGTYTISPNAGYIIDDVLVDGVSQGAISSYTFEDVKADHTIRATFKPTYPTISFYPASKSVDVNFTTSENYVTLTGYYFSALNTTLKASLNGASIDITNNSLANTFSLTLNTAGMNSTSSPYNVEVFATNSVGTSSCTAQIKIVNTKPVLTVSPSSALSLSKGDNLVVSAAASDINVGQPLSIEYKIDSGEWTEAVTGTAGTELSQLITISTENISYGNHTFNVRAYDGIEYVYCNDDASDTDWDIIIPEPTITLSPVDDQPYTEDDNYVAVSGTYTSVVDFDIKASFDGSPAEVTIDADNNMFTVKINTKSKSISNNSYSVTAAIENVSGSDTSSTGVKVINLAPVLTIADSSSSSVEKNEDFIINASASDVNVGQPLSIEYKIDNGEWVEAASGIAGTELKKTISIPTDTLSYGNHTFNVRAYDGIEYVYAKNNTEDQSWQVHIPEPTISLTSSVAPDQQYTMNRNSISFSGTYTSVVDSEISAKFDGAAVDVSVDDVNKTFSVEIDTSSKDVSETPYILEITISNDGGSASCEGSVKIINTKPTLTIPESLVTSLNKGDAFSIDVSADDINVGQPLSIEYKIDNGDWIEAASGTAGQTLQATISIPTDTLSYGKHSFNIRADDGLEYTYVNPDNTSLDWHIIIPVPEIDLSISNIEDQQFTINDNFIDFSGTFDSAVDSIISAAFDSSPINDIKIDPDKKTFSIRINTAGKAVSEIPYELNIKIQNDGGEQFCKGFVKVINQKPSISIADTISTTIEKNDSFIIPVMVSDINAGQQLTVEVRIDDGEWTEALTKTAGAAVEGNIEIPTEFLSYGNHTFNVRAYDGIEYSYPADEESSLTWKIHIPVPSISLTTSETPDQQFTIEDNFITLDGTFDSVVHSNIDANFNGSPVNVNVDNENKTFSIVLNTAGLPVSETPYKLEITVTNDEGSSSCSRFVKIINESPSVIIPNDLTLSLDKGTKLQIPVTVTDINVGQPLTLEVQVDGGNWLETATATAGQEMKYTIEIDTSALAYKSHTFNVRAFDGIEYSYAFEDNGQSWEIPVPAPKIQITSSEVPVQQYTTLENKVSFEGTYSSEVDCTITATFDEVPLDVSINNEAKTFTVDIDTAGKSVSTDPYKLELTIENESGKDVCSSLVFVVNTPPEIIMPKDISSSVKKGSSFTIAPIINDINIGQTITVEYNLDDGEWVEAATGIAGEELSPIIEIPTNNLDSQSHTFNLRAYDGLEYTLAQASSYQFRVLAESSPLITIANIPNQQYSSKKNVVLITGKVSDPEGKKGIMTCNGQSVEIIWDTETEGHFEMEYDTSGKDVGFIANLKFVYDAAEADASTIIINSPPFIKMTKLPNSYSIAEDISIPCTVSDPNIGQELLLYYSLDGGKWVFCNKSTATGNEESVSVVIPASKDLIGSHKLRVMVTDRYNYCIDAIENYSGVFNPEIDEIPEIIEDPLDAPDKGYSCTFVDKNNSPELTINKMASNQVENQDIVATLTIKDEDGQKDTIYYQINNLEPVSLGKVIATGQNETISVIIPPLPIGDYTVTFFAEDEEGLKSNDDGDILISDKDVNVGNKINIKVVPESSSPIADFESYFLHKKNTPSEILSNDLPKLAYYELGEGIIELNPAQDGQNKTSDSKDNNISSADTSKINDTKTVSTGVDSTHSSTNVFVLIGLSISLYCFIFFKKHH